MQLGRLLSRTYHRIGFTTICRE